MRLTPAQIGDRLICGDRLPPFGEAKIIGKADLKEWIRTGHDSLVSPSSRALSSMIQRPNWTNSLRSAAESSSSTQDLPYTAYWRYGASS